MFIDTVVAASRQHGIARAARADAAGAAASRGPSAASGAGGSCSARQPVRQHPPAAATDNVV